MNIFFIFILYILLLYYIYFFFRLCYMIFVVQYRNGSFYFEDVENLVVLYVIKLGVGEVLVWYRRFVGIIENRVFSLNQKGEEVEF